MSYILTRPWFWALAVLVIIISAYFGREFYVGGSMPRDAKLRQDYATATKSLEMARGGSNQAMYDQAILAYASVLGRWKPEEAPRKRAAVMLTLADALLEAGRVKSDTNSFNQAYGYYLEAQKVLTRASSPAEWARAQYGAGVAVEELAARMNPQFYTNAALLYKAGLESFLYPERNVAPEKPAEAK